MPCLQTANLSPAEKAELAINVASTDRAHGVVSKLAAEQCLSRPTLYASAKQARQLLTEHFDKTMKAQEPTIQVSVDRAQLERAVVGLRMETKASIRSIENVLSIIYPEIKETTLPTSFGSIQGTLHKAQDNAGVFNETVVLSPIVNGAADEMFSQCSPVLAGIDLDTGYLFSLALKAARGETQWAEVLESARSQGVNLAVVVKDAAKGIAAGVSRVFPNAEQRDDCFHVLYVLGQYGRTLERKAYGAINAEQELRVKLGKYSGNLTELFEQFSHAKARCRDAIHHFECHEKAMRQVREALSFVCLKTGELNTGDKAQARYEKAAGLLEEIGTEKANKHARYLRNRIPGLLLSTDTLCRKLLELAEDYSLDLVSWGCQVIRINRDLLDNVTPWYQSRLKRGLALAQQMVEDVTGPHECQQLFKAINHALDTRYRASSAIEGFNASLRPFLYNQKRVSQAFLELFKAFHNLRTRRWGKHKGTSAHQLVTGTKSDDWLALLGFPRSQISH